MRQCAQLYDTPWRPLMAKLHASHVSSAGNKQVMLAGRWGKADCSEVPNTPALRRSRMEALGRRWAQLDDAGAAWPGEGSLAATLLPSPDDAPTLDVRCQLHA